MTPTPLGSMAFDQLLLAQVGHEFTASQQYISIAVWFDTNDLPQLARRFYAQAAEERGHALMMIRYLVDRGVKIAIPGLGDTVTQFAKIAEPVELALAQESTVTDQITALARTARAEGDYIGERFVQWFLQEQVEEVASIRSLLNIVRRAGGQLFDIEEYVARETNARVNRTTDAPKIAGAF
ncbi:ferritin [Rhodococcus sp. G-MC3]|uniref:ferritin n=1 Tax=Rhodococcus sp. G-MC3 TaxID=3046209 RepID=UPI0024B8A38B|nr:ferritin [Rhodococcus sp. G-MC3]MDJ0394346.1 ferritin [Rhodococcus sp. G-MC3]